MTGPEHYRMAEQLLNGIAIGENPNDPTGLDNAAIAAAQVHATLALAAATAMNDAEGGMTVSDYRAWLQVASEDDPYKARRSAADVDPVTGRDYAEEAWQRAEAEREGLEELAAEQDADDDGPMTFVAYHAAAGVDEDGIAYEAAEPVQNVTPDFAAGNLVNVSDPEHKHWGTRGSVIGYVYDPLGVVVEYDNLGNTFTVRPDQLMHHLAFIEQESRAEFAADPSVTGRRADGGIEP